MYLLISVKNALGMNVGIVWKRNKNRGIIAIFMELILPANDNGRDDHLVKSCLVLSSSTFKVIFKKILESLSNMYT